MKARRKPRFRAGRGEMNMKKILKQIDTYFEEVVLSCMMAYFLFATTAQVIARFVLKISAP